jgi:uncharacterized protein (TIGR02246 family)
MHTQNGPDSPHALLEAFSRHAAAGDVEGLLALYELGARFDPVPGVACVGHDEIRLALAELVATSPVITYEGDHQVVAVDDIALVSTVWSMTGTAPDGEAVTDSGTSADVLRRQGDGTWAVVIDRPHGVAPVG